jgi:hypothetical protein
MATVGLVGCSRRKLPHAAPAAELYTSLLFRLASQFCAATCSCWFILSAKHGLVMPDEVIEPYDVTLRGMGRQGKLAWARRVAAQLRERGLLDGDNHFQVHAGADYASPLAQHFPVEQPLEGLAIGQRLAWYRRQLAALPERKPS